MEVSGRICLYVACYDFVLGFNVSSLVLMIFQADENVFLGNEASPYC